MGCGKHFHCYPLVNILFAVVLEVLIQLTRCFSAQIAFLCSLSEFSADVYKPVLQLLQILRDLLESKKQGLRSPVIQYGFTGVCP